MHLPEGTILQNGKYKIVRFINSGGFGCTYEGVQTLMGARIAIKEFFVNDFCNRDNDNTVSVGTKSKINDFQKLKKSFIKEAIALFHMQHSHIVRVIDVFEENGTAYYVMDYIDGGSLADMVKQKGRLSESEALGYIKQVCDALKYVHSQNRLHLDIKPANIMVDKNGKAILIDFGTSKYYDQETGEQTSTLLGVLTKSYAPLEQIKGSFKTFNPAADIYSLGATLYKLLTGVTPPTALDLLTPKVTLQRLPANISASTRKAVESAMQIDNEQRPQSIEEFESILFAPTTIVDDEKTTLDNGEISKPNPIHKEQVKTEKKDVKNKSNEETHFDAPKLNEGIEEFKELKEEVSTHNKPEKPSTSNQKSLIGVRKGKFSRPKIYIGAALAIVILISFLAFFSLKEKPLSEADGVINGHEYVDLGLPSGLKWATSNIGSLAIEDPGEYFCWGETDPQIKYNDVLAYKKDKDWLLENGYIDDEDNLTLSYDAANQIWGGPWRMPTGREFGELLTYTNQKWTTHNGMYGCHFKSRMNGKSIFLPVTRYQLTSFNEKIWDDGAYWSSTAANNSKDSYFLQLEPNYFSTQKELRNFHCTIRPVSY